MIISNWQCLSDNENLKFIFGTSEIITISRQDVFNSTSDIRWLIYKTLLWGYPTMGRGGNIKNLLGSKNSENFENLVDVLTGYRKSEVPVGRLENALCTIKHVGFSTMTKFLYFLKAKIDGYECLIFDSRIMKVINLSRFDELRPLKGVKNGNAIKNYPKYLRIVHEVANEMGVDTANIEMFLYMFGGRLSEKQ